MIMTLLSTYCGRAHGWGREGEARGWGREGEAPGWGMEGKPLNGEGRGSSRVGKDASS